MITKRVLVMGTDNAYFEYTVIALRSFMLHNPGWSILVMDIGMTPDQVDFLRRFARIVAYPRDDFRGPGRFIPSAKARCLALSELPDAQTLMLYLDGDTVTLGSVESMVDEFLCSGHPIGLGSEDDPRFFAMPVRHSWSGGEVPAEFTNRLAWQELPILNTGVLLATGPIAASIGGRSSALYEELKDRFLFGEQTIIDSVLYDDGVGFYKITINDHCFIHERFLVKSGRPYIDPVYLDGKPVLIRHFCHDNKRNLDAYRTPLIDYYADFRTVRIGGPPSASSAKRLADRAESDRLHHDGRNDKYFRTSIANWMGDLCITPRRVIECSYSSQISPLELKRGPRSAYYGAIFPNRRPSDVRFLGFDETFVCDPASITPSALGLLEGGFDCLIALDALNQSISPLEQLTSLTKFINQDGCLVISVYNIQNISILESLSLGRWDYQESGLLDANHTRFFTWDGILKLFEEAGLEIIASTPLLFPALDVSELSEDSYNLSIGKLTLNNLTREELISFHAYKYNIVARRIIFPDD